MPLVINVIRHSKTRENDTAWKTWAEILPEATFIEVPETGHLLPMEKPATVAQLIGDFIKALR